MAGTQVEALSRLEVQSSIQRDLFQMAEERMAMHKASRRDSERGSMRMRGMQYAPNGYSMGDTKHGFLRPVTRAVVILLSIAILLPVIAG